MNLYLDKYLSLNFSNIDGTLLNFWYKNRHEFPKLSAVAKKILSIPASSAENERSFSKLNYILNDRRDSLSAETIDSLFIAKSFNDFI